jgi:hypothetical protein
VGEEHVESDSVSRQQLRIAKVADDVGFVVRSCRKRRVGGQPAPKEDPKDKIKRSDGDEAVTPAWNDKRNEVMGGGNSGEDAAEETSEHGAADVDGHHLRHAMARPLLGDVCDGDTENSGHDEALEKSPEDQLRETVGSGCKDGGN